MPFGGFTNPKILSPEELRAIDEASRELLEETGFHVRDGALLERLEGMGLEVDQGRKRVRVASGRVQEALALTPRRVQLHNRRGEPIFALGGGAEFRFAAGFNATFTLDAGTGERRRACKADVASYARLAQHLSGIDMVGPQVVPHDVPPCSSTLHAVEAVLENTAKPILFAPDDEQETAALIEILRAVTGETEIGHAPIGICQFSPSSPLFWSDCALKGFLRIVAAGFPCTILPGPLAGATSPYSLAANLVQKNAEVLAAVVMAQLVRPGTPLLCNSAGGQFDMRFQTAVFGSPEVLLLLMAGTQLAQSYGLPTHACFPSSDSHSLDEQLGIENSMQLLACLFSGVDLMVNAGMFAAGETACPEQMVIDNDICGALRRLSRGIEVDEQHLCRDALRRVGPGGSFLEEPSTLANLRSEEWWEPAIMGRQRYEQWKDGGAASVVQRAREGVQQISGREERWLEGEQKRRVEQIIADFERACAEA
jgi:trimethylamine--corrinoid protein Co-methyltransferase